MKLIINQIIIIPTILTTQIQFAWAGIKIKQLWMEASKSSNSGWKHLSKID